MLYGALGWCAVALALAGVILPGLPTTIFILIASYCFSRSSARFERWLRENRWLGPRLQRIAGAGGMPPSAKRAALTAMWVAVLLSSSVLMGDAPDGGAGHPRTGSAGDPVDPLLGPNGAGARRCILLARHHAAVGHALGVRKIFAGLMSRCTMPAPWAASSASARALAMSTRSGTSAVRETAVRAAARLAGAPDEKRPTVCRLADVVHGADVRVLERSDGFGLAAKALPRRRRLVELGGEAL